MADVILLRGKEKRVYSGHPWVFHSDIARTKSDPQPGDVCVTEGGGHCGIYVGDGQMIHAATEGVGVIQSDVQSNMKIVRPN